MGGHVGAHWRMKRCWGAAALAALLALGGCAPTTRLTAVSATGTPHATLAATATRQPTPTDASTQASVTALTFDPVSCPSVPPSNDVLTYQRVGDLLFLTDRAPFFYTTQVQVPDGVPAAPLVEPDAP